MGKLFGVKSDWEFIVWCLIKRCITKDQRDFTLSDIYGKRDGLKKMYFIYKQLGHKEDPQNSEATIRKTLQKMRDKGWIGFINRGEYEVTDNGYRELLAREEDIETMKIISSGMPIASPN